MHLPQNFAAKSGFPYLVDIKISEFCPFNCKFCFTPDTKILTEKGEVKLAELKVRDKVYSFNELTQSVETDEISEVMERFVEEDILEIELENGIILRVTDEHPFFAYGEWIEAGSLQVGISLYGFEESVKIKSIKRVKYNGKVMNLHVEKNNNYFANRILAHNCYQSSTKEGEHGDGMFLSYTLPKLLMKAGVLEVNFGGGEPTLYKGKYTTLNTVLSSFKAKKFKVGITTKNYNWHKSKDFAECIKYIDSVAISVNSLEELESAEELEKSINEVSGGRTSVYYQCVFELVPYEQFKQFILAVSKKYNRNITLLGYKDFGFGKNGEKYNYPDEWIGFVKAVHDKTRLNIGIDSVMVKNWREKLITFGIKDYYLVGTEGKSTCYIDAVKQKMYSSSFSDEKVFRYQKMNMTKVLTFYKTLLHYDISER